MEKGGRAWTGPPVVPGGGLILRQWDSISAPGALPCSAAR